MIVTKPPYGERLYGDQLDELLDIFNGFGDRLSQDFYVYVNFDDYLNTGIFLDHHKIRQLVAKAAKSKTLLNLFSYTCTASVHAGLKGAKTTSVDMSNTYLDCGKNNFTLNNIDVKKRNFIQADYIS